MSNEQLKNILIVGAGGLAKEVASLIKDINHNNKQWNIIGYIDQNEEKIGKKLNGIPIVGTDNTIVNSQEKMSIVFGIGNQSIRKKLYQKYKKNLFINYPNLTHPNVVRDKDNIILGLGNIVFAGNVITTSIKIGNFNTFYYSCTLSHDCIVGDYNQINPGVNISGNVIIGNEVLLGTGSQILQNISICSKSIVGAGAVVTKNLTEKGVYIGTPAKKISS